MATKKECDIYAAELAQRYEEFTKWAIANWPRKDCPLILSDFEGSRRELADILGPKLDDGLKSDQAEGNDSGGPQYRDMNPMPWP